MSVIDGEINVDCSGQDSALAAAFATIIVRNKMSYLHQISLS